MQWASRQPGFTIVELLIVVVVIAILAAITVVAYNGVQSRALTSVLQSDVRNAATALALYHTTNGSYPTPANLGLVNDGKGLAKSDTTTFQYDQLSSGAGFCLTATSSRSGVGAHYISNSTSLQVGACSGHSTTTPTEPVALECPAGYIVVPGNSIFGTSDFCVMKYEAKNVGGYAVSQAAGTPWVSISQTAANSESAVSCSGCHLITEAEWMTIAANVLSVASNWSGGSVGGGYVYAGHSDNAPGSALAASTNDASGYTGTGNTAGQSLVTFGMQGNSQRRTLTLTNGETIWDFAGNVWEWTSGTIAGGQHPGLPSASEGAWIEWNNPSLAMHGLPAVSRPGTISSTVAGYGSDQGVGKLYAYYGETTARSFQRGGSWGDGQDKGSGVLTLAIDDLSSASRTYVGFRVAK